MPMATTLDSIAPRGFHTFNSDIYIDTDLREGSDPYSAAARTCR
jgi:hypothetical protein